MYHGTNRANVASIMASGFHRSDDGLLGSGVYLSSDLKKACYYPNGHPEYDKVVIKVLVDVGRVITISDMDHPRRKTWQDPKYGEVFDTAWIPPGCGLVREVDCVRDPNQIMILDIIHPQPVPPGYMDLVMDIDMDLVMDMDMDLDIDMDLDMDMDMDLHLDIDMDMDLNIVMDMDMDLDIVMDMDMDLDIVMDMDLVMDMDMDLLMVMDMDLDLDMDLVIDLDLDMDMVMVMDMDIDLDLDLDLDMDMVMDMDMDMDIDLDLDMVMDMDLNMDMVMIMVMVMVMTNMYQQQQFQWAEDNFTLPMGVGRLGLSEPVECQQYVMYHGTNRANIASILTYGFHQSKDGMPSPGIYLSSDLKKARYYPNGHPEYDKVVFRVLIDVWREKHNWGSLESPWSPPLRFKALKPLKTEHGTAVVTTPINIEINMYRAQFQWAEDDFDLPEGVSRLGLSAPIDGKKYVMYHGTTKESAEAIMRSGFHQSSGGMLGPGVYLSRDLNKASRYPIDHPEHDKVVIKVSVNVGKVIAINYQGHPRQKTWHDYGYDTAWVPPNCGMVKSGLEEDCVWDPNRVKIIMILRPTYDFDLPEGVGRLGLSAPIDGKKYVMYHGTTKESAEAIMRSGFHQSSGGMLGPGVYLSRDLNKASRYPLKHPEHDRVVIKVSVNVGKVIRINYQGHPRQKTWQDSRYGPVFDTAWVPPKCGMVPSGLEEDCVWDPNRIKILSKIKPRPAQSGYGAQGYM
ncbi:uncharacterized protein LOC128379346 [Scomber japonicus]|uniref:uncharacterized protein LOC128379346 n=1 Tax=Scomber japonicus TaxID=13676 RepID=UPI0023068FA5|nr:uncharacterized protein LOC128379346 [Scomber japonicus]